MLRTPVVVILIITAAAPVRAQLALSQDSILVDRAGNEVLEANETAGVEPSWRNVGVTPPTICGLGGSLGSFTGPLGATYSVVDGSGHYQGCFVPQGPPVRCSDCYSVRIVAGARPVPHWDSTILEGPAGIQSQWVLHVGSTFTDVPATSGFYRFIETIVHKNVTGGCSTTTYCPTADTTRDAMAVFVLVSKEPAGYVPPACGATPRFADVPVASGFCPWIEELARRGVVSGCAPNLYCPTAPATREQMAVFVLRTLDPTLDPPACVAGSEVFADVPASNGFCRWIEELFRRNVVTGCGGGNYCPTSAVTREQMSVFLTVTFGLTLYAP